MYILEFTENYLTNFEGIKYLAYLAKTHSLSITLKSQAQRI